MSDDRTFKRHWTATARGTKFAHTTFCWTDVRLVLRPYNKGSRPGLTWISLALEKMQWPHLDRQEAGIIVDYFDTVAEEIQEKAGRDCMVEIVAYPDSLSLDTREHFQPQATLRFQIRHGRGLEQPSGPAEEQALRAFRKALRELGVKPV